MFLRLVLFTIIGSRAELGSRPSVEGPVDPNGATEYTEQTLDAESQVGASTVFYLCVISIKTLEELRDVKRLLGVKLNDLM